MKLTGSSIIGPVPAQRSGSTFRPTNPATGKPLEPAFQVATSVDLDRAVRMAAECYGRYDRVSGGQRAVFLRTFSAELAQQQTAIVERAQLETALGLPRLRAEMERTTAQLELFADLIAEGSWVDARIDHGVKGPSAKHGPDVRSMRRSIGPVAVFGASNFPLACSVAGNDTVAALAAGNTVVVKAHPCHPGTSELVGRTIRRAIERCDMPCGMFSVLIADGVELGLELVGHPGIRAVGFTGSRRAGLALMQRAAQRPEPIPVYAEMGSINPVFLLPSALASAPADIAAQLGACLWLGVGQYCTNPGLLVAQPGAALDQFVAVLRERIETSAPECMLSEAIARAYTDGLQRLAAHPAVEQLAGDSGATGAAADASSCLAKAALFGTDAADFLRDRTLMAEIFGPATLLVRCRDLTEMVEVASQLEGQLSVAMFASEPELPLLSELRSALEQRVGRLILNGVPTGVAVCPAMVHGGPFPATSDGQSSSVGTRAIERFSRALCYQDYPDTALPPELRDDNPLRIWRLVDGRYGRH